jgi:sugar phosphate isomerase/epimerase
MATEHAAMGDEVMRPSRREWLTAAGATVGVGLAADMASARPGPRPFRFCLNTSTIRGQNLPLVEEIDLVHRAGYDAIEPWLHEIEKYAAGGGSLKDLHKRLRDNNLVVADVIAFHEWVVNDESRRKKGLEAIRRSMDLIRQIGAERLAAPPAGAKDSSDIDLFKVAERYRVLLEMGDKFGVVPQVEVWGFSKTLGRLSEGAFAAVESGHPKACVLADIYHLYKGGSGFEGLRLLSSEALQVIHMNDYPADPPRDKIVDAQRVLPGDGIAPFKAIFQTLRRIGFSGYLSLELFNDALWKQDALHVARLGLERMRAVARLDRD